MSKARLIITAITVEHCTQAEAARRYGVSPGWVSKLMARYRAEGDAALEPRSRAPKHSPTRINATTIALIVQLRTQLLERGLDAGAHTIAWHLHHHHSTVGRLHHIGLGRTLARTRVIVLLDGLEIRVVHRRTGELIRELTLDTTRDYQPQEPKNPRT